MDERAAFEAWYLGHFYMGDKQCGLEWLSTEPCGGYRHQHPAEQWIVWQARAALSAPSHGGGVAHTDCGSEDGITVGLIDSIITSCRVLSSRDLTCEAAVEALRDLRSDSDVSLIKPSHGEQVRQMVPQLPAFAQKVISKLKRFEECTDDGQGADIGRHWFDLLTQLGLLNRVQRSPGLWEITAQGEDVLAAPSACSCGEPDAAGTHRKDGPCYWGPSAPSAGSQEQG